MIERRLTPEDALDYQVRMLHSVRSPDFVHLMAEALQPFIVAQEVPKSEQKDFSIAMYDLFYDTLVNGETLLLGEETTRLTEYAASVLPDYDRYDCELAPFRQAMVFFEKPLTINVNEVKAGGVTSVQVTWMLFFDTPRPEDDPNPMHVYFVGMRFPDDPWDATRNIGMMAAGPQSSLGRQSDQRGIDKLIEAGFMGDVDDIVAFNPKPFVQAMWALMGQPIISSAIVRPINPPLRKMRKKMGNGATVRVLKVRQRSGGSSAVAGSREWSHRWVVRGFWRMQRCGQGGADRKRIWVDSYIKGPADKPLLLGDKVYKE